MEIVKVDAVEESYLLGEIFDPSLGATFPVRKAAFMESTAAIRK